MNAIEYIKANFHKECLIPDQTDDLCIHAILELDARVKVLEIDNQATQMFINEQEDLVAKPIPTDDKYCTCEGEKITWFDRSLTTDGKGKILQDMCDRCCTCGKEVNPSYNAETIKAMEDVKEGKNIITIPLDELFKEDCGKEAKPTDEELIIVALNSIEYEMRENPSWYTEAIKILRQLIAEE